MEVRLNSMADFDVLVDSSLRSGDHTRWRYVGESFRHYLVAHLETYSTACEKYTRFELGCAGFHLP